MSDLKFLKKAVRETIAREKYGLLTEISDDDTKVARGPISGDDTKVIRGPTSNRSSREDSGESSPVQRLSSEQFIKRFDKFFAPSDISFEKIAAKALLKFLNDKRAETGISDDTPVDRLFDDFKNSDFAQKHLQSYVTEEED